MGWWTINRSGRELVLGDTPFDIIGEAFQQVAQEYQEGWNRKPTLAEVIETIETVLAIGVDRNYQPQCQNKETQEESAVSGR